ncbi:MAG TPA: 3D domain-containing protein [Candidatus Baltobacteraceae bacterium]|nr:3D domain-containing protein [Candidatus Baltobacteraceae bacterium]
MIGLTANRASHIIGIGLLTLGLATAGFVTNPLTAAAVGDAAATHVVLFESHGTQTQHVTSAQTVGAFLQERGIVPGPHDYVRPDVDTTLTDNEIVEYSPAVPVRLVTASGSKTVITTAEDVGALLEEQGVHLGAHDIVRPSLSDPIVPFATIRIARVVTWTSSEKRRLSEHTIHVIDFSLPPGKTKILRSGSPGISESMVDYTQTDGKIDKRVLETRVLRRPETRIIAEGVGTYAAMADFARQGLQKTSYIAASALDMVATAYTADCIGCSGYTATGYRAGHGIVAVDPRIIPLGSKLYIPGYGFAIAGDTGGAIVGNRIDLGFDSIADALQFGRRAVKVYTLK